jgi:GT2 family glycosyltransferase
MNTEDFDTRITIVIPNHNGAHLLGPCLASVCQQSYQKYAVVVVDNGSTDDSMKVVEQYDNRVSVIQLNHNSGFGRAVNLGIRSTTTELIFVLNNDTLLDSLCLAEVVKAVDSYPDYGFFAPKICEYAQQDRVYAAGLMLSERGYGNRSQRFLLQPRVDPVEVFGACGAGAIYRRKVLDEVGLFNEDYLFLYEDLELSYRHQLLGHRCLYLPSAILFHHGSVTLKRFVSTAVREAVKNSLMTLLTCTPTAMWKSHFLKIVKFYLGFWRSVIRKGFTIELLEGLSWTAFRFVTILKRRAELQRRSVIDIGHLNDLLYTGPIYVNFPNGTIKL